MFFKDTRHEELTNNETTSQKNILAGKKQERKKNKQLKMNQELKKNLKSKISSRNGRTNSLALGISSTSEIFEKSGNTRARETQNIKGHLLIMSTRGCVFV